jgi:glycosyltransferase involved in cell wall biosynthesis
MSDVLLASNLFPPAVIGGYETAAFDVANGLRSRGIDISVLTTDFNNGGKLPEDPWVSRSLRLTSGWYEKLPPAERVSAAKHNYMQTLEHVRSNCPKLVYAWNQSLLGTGVLEAVSDLGVPILHHIMGYDLLAYLPRRSLKERILYQLFHRNQKQGFSGQLSSRRHMANMVFLSRHMQKHYNEKGVYPVISKIIYPGIRHDMICEKEDYDIDRKVVRLAYVGQLAEHKGVLVLRQALSLLVARRRDMQIRLTLYGDGPQMITQQLEDEPPLILIDRRGLIDREIMYGELKDHDIGIFCSLWEEPFGIAQIEIMAAGLPIVTSAMGGSAEAVCDGRNALVYTAQDSEMLSRRIEEIIDAGIERREYLGKNARQTVEESFTSQISLDQVAKVVRGMMF